MAKLPRSFGKIPDSPVPFGDRLSALCAFELSAAHNDAERVGAMIERLVNALAFTIAIATRADPKLTDDMITSAVSHLYEMATSHAIVSDKLEALKRR